MVKPTLLTIECHGNLSSGKAKATFVDFRHASKVKIWFVFEISNMVPIMTKIEANCQKTISSCIAYHF